MGVRLFYQLFHISVELNAPVLLTDGNSVVAKPIDDFLELPFLDHYLNQWEVLLTIRNPDSRDSTDGQRHLGVEPLRWNVSIEPF